MRVSFFQSIKYQYGQYAVKSFKLWIKYNKIIIRCNLKIEFLRKCIEHGVMPSHISSCLARFDNSWFDPRTRGKYKHCKRRFARQLLHIELNDTFCYVRFAYSQIFKISSSLYGDIPMFICNSFFNRQSGPMYSFFVSQRARMDKKFTLLVSRSIDQSRNSMRIKYFCSIPPTQQSMKFSFEPLHAPPDHSLIEVVISPDSVSEAPSTLNEINDKWFINLSSTSIPRDIQCLLQLGDNFSLPVAKPQYLTLEFIKSIEHNLIKFPLAKQTAVRYRLAPIINNIPNYSIPRNNFNNNILKLSAATKKFLNNNRNLILTRADKGNVTVALDKDKYIAAIETMLNDRNTYLPIMTDPTKKLISSSRELLTRWKNANYITGSMHKSLYCSDGNLPRAYGLPKIHKPNCPFRLIISSINSPLYDLASFLHRIMFKSFPIARSFVKNSIDLVEKLASIHVNDGYKLISLDVVSLFTNVPIERVLDSISVRWNFIAKNCNIPKSEFFTAVRLILNSTFFMFNGKIYRQTFGVPMGSPLSPMAADIVLQDLETIALCTLKYIPPFYKRYIDDITLAAPSTLLQHTLDIFNSFHPRLKFTIEIGEDDKLNFLEITMMLNNNRLTFDWFHKPTFSGRYLNFMSQHPVCQKRGTAIGLIDRAFLLSHPSLHAKNLSLVIGILLNNCYPLEFIYGILRERLKFLFNRDSNMNVRRNEEEVAPFFTLPYIPMITEKFKNAIRELNVRLSYNSLNKMRTFIKAQKDSLPRSNKCNVVYKINCNDCDASYVGQTSR
ncbi:uncharacterized protein [Temnothorax nylanderi]|uniref:uncharacterized protein n=1 Tax=Temnothorax nylanderi TaxID=102681 RepID=UPI003A86A3F1